MTPFDLPRGSRRYLEIARRLAAAIDAGEPESGARLPPERDLAQSLGVSRTTVREALLALEIMRYVEIRVGAGVYVLPPAHRATTPELAAQATASPSEVLEARRLIEGWTAARAAELATAEEVDRIAAETERMAAAIDDVPAFDRADAAFHAAIAAAAGNGILEGYVAHLWRMRETPMWERWYAQTRHPANRRRSVEDHRRLLAALRRRAPDAARTAMETHLDVLADRFFALRLQPPEESLRD